MSQHDNAGASLATVALVCAVLAFSLWVLSFSWVPFAMAGRPVGSFRYVIVAAEVGALLVALLSTGLGLVARSRSGAGGAGRQATRALVMGGAVLVFLVGFNVLGLIFGS